MKVARNKNSLSKVYIADEIKTYVHLSSLKELNKYVPKFIGQTLFGDLPVLITEYINQSIEEYIHDHQTN